MRKPKLDLAAQIAYFRDAGVAFEGMKEPEARTFLTQHNYFSKIKSYLINFPRESVSESGSKCRESGGESAGESKRKPGRESPESCESCGESSPESNPAVRLDFAHLVEISKLDMYLRRTILSLSIHAEHLLKTSLNAHFGANEKEDGYEIVEDFLAKDPKSADFVLKKFGETPALWEIIEVLEFGNFLKLYRVYFEKYPSEKHLRHGDLGLSVRLARNAAAHNNGILSQPVPGKVRYSRHLAAFLERFPREIRPVITGNQMLCDFCALLLLFSELCQSQKMQKAARREVLALLKRCRREGHFFAQHSAIKRLFGAFRGIIFHTLFSKNKGVL